MGKTKGVLLICGCMVVALLLAGCQGDDEDNNTPAPTPITTAVQAQQVAAFLPFSPWEDAGPNHNGRFAKRFGPAVAAPQLPGMDKDLLSNKLSGKFAQMMRATEAAPQIFNCSGGGTVEVDIIDTAEIYKISIVYVNCIDIDSGTRSNGKYYGEETYSETSNSYIYVTGNGDQDVDDAEDLVFEEIDPLMNVTSIMKSSSTMEGADTLKSKTPTLSVSDSNGNFIGKWVSSDANNLSVTSAAFSSKGTKQEFFAADGSYLGNETEYLLDTAINFSGNVSGIDVGLSYTATNLDVKGSNRLTATGGEETTAFNGSYALDLSPDSCFSGWYTVKTLVPRQRLSNYSTGDGQVVAGEFEVNGAARVVLSNNGVDDIQTVYLGADTTPTFSGTEAELADQLGDICPIVSGSGWN